jgi:hypothetical protein
MPSVFDKLNLKQQREILVVDAPPSFEAELQALDGVAVLRDPKQAKAVSFALAFATRQAEVDALSAVLARKAEGDALLWFAYPKGSSKRYQCEFNRDTGWEALRRAGFDTVRQVAIDEDWSALRFRRVEYIKPSQGRAYRAPAATVASPAASRLPDPAGGSAPRSRGRRSPA